MQKKDIQTEQDIQFMVNSFYDKVNLDPILSPIFNDFAQVNWQAHLPKMYQFWGKMLLNKGVYNGHPFPPHVPLPIDASHFERWITIFVANLDQHFEGEVTDMAKIRATSIAQIFQSKLSFIKQYT